MNYAISGCLRELLVSIVIFRHSFLSQPSDNGLQQYFCRAFLCVTKNSGIVTSHRRYFCSHAFTQSATFNPTCTKPPRQHSQDRPQPIPPHHQHTDSNSHLKHPVPHRHFPVCNPLFVGQQLIIMTSVRFRQVFTIFHTNGHGGQFIHIKRKQKRCHADKVQHAFRR